MAGGAVSAEAEEAVAEAAGADGSSAMKDHQIRS